MTMTIFVFVIQGLRPKIQIYDTSKF